jgi:hypothetical protein
MKMPSFVCWQNRSDAAPRDSEPDAALKGDPIMETRNHARLGDAGWAYRTNSGRGWIIYRDPETRLWHSQVDAIRVLDGREKAA